MKRKMISIFTALVIIGSLTLPVLADTLSGDGDTLNNKVGNAINLTVESGETWKLDNCGVTVTKSNGNTAHVDISNGVQGTISADTDLKLDKTSWQINNYDEYARFTVEGTAPINNGTQIITLPAYKVTLTCTSNDDLDGLNNTTDFFNINITVKPAQVTTPADTTAPTIIWDVNNPATGYNVWHNTYVSLGFTLSDDLSGVDISRSTRGPLVFNTEGANQTQDVFAYDLANPANHTTYTSPIVNIDMTKPTITGSTCKVANAAGWYNSDVTVSFDAADDLSGVASSTAPVTLTEGKDQSVTGTATDKAGNIAEATVSGINIDKTAPTINVEEGATYTLNQAVAWSASDALSGLATSASGTIDTSKVGNQTQTITAYDNAGNKKEITINYTVVYAFGGILDPINANGNSLFKAGSTVPVKFQLKDAAGAFVSSASATLTYAKLSNNVLGTDLEAVSTSAATTGNAFRYDSTSNQYIFNFSTKGLSAGTYQLTIKLNDNKSYTVQISLK